MNKNAEKVMKEYIKKHQELAGVEFLRDAVKFFDNRNEWSNSNKSPMKLLDEAFTFYGLDDEEEQHRMLNEAEPEVNYHD